MDGIANRGIEAHVTLQYGALEANVRGSWVDSLRADLPAVLAVLLDVARSLGRPPDIPSRIAANIRDEPEAGVRLRSILLLAQKHPNHPATRAALSRGCRDESQEVRFRAAMALKDDGRDVLLEMASSGSVPEALAVQALLALGEHVPVERTRALLESALSAERVELASACMRSMACAGGPDVIATLAKLVADEGGELAAAAARALGTVPASIAAESALLEGLDRARPEIRLAAAEALGHVGSVAAIPLLEEAGARESAERELRRVVRQAVADIQARLQGAAPGQLSLAEAESGNLSLAEEGPAGQVSLAKPDPSDGI